MRKHVHEGHRQRLRENVLKNGLENMQQHNVLEYVLSFVVPRKDTNVLAHNLIRKFGSFKAVLHSSPKELQTVKGVGNVVAVYLSTLKDIINYYNKNDAKNNFKIINSFDTAYFFKQLFSGLKQEEFYVACVNNHGQISHFQKLSLGADNNVTVKIKDILNILNKHLCTNFIVSHNHPAGESKPSKNDISFTKTLYISARLAGYTLIDHVIIGEQCFFSFRDEGHFERFEELVENLK